MTKTSLKLPVWIFLVALAPRLLLFAGAGSWKPDFPARTIQASDGHEYDALAKTLLSSGRFAPSPDGPPEALRTPGYPVFLALFYGATGANPWLAILVQIGLDAATAMLLFAALRRRFPVPLAAAAGLLYGLEPMAILYSNWLLSDTLFLHLLVVGLYFLLRWSSDEAEARRASYLALAAVAWGLAAWVRPPALFLAILLMPAAYLVGGVRHLNRTAKASVLALVTFGAIVAPWVGRNWAVFGTPGFSVSGAYNLLALYVTPMELERRQLPYNEVKRALVVEADSLMRADGKDPAQLDSFAKAPYWKARALHYITARPLDFILTTGQGVAHSFLNLGTQSYSTLLNIERRGEVFHTRSHRPMQDRVRHWVQRYGPLSLFLAAVVVLYQAGVLAGGLVGLGTAWRRPPLGVWIVLLGLAGFFLAASAGAGVARYRLPAVPFYLPFVAAGWLWLRARVTRPSGS